MADHPLRPATDRSLGGPLPHQLANRTRARPRAFLFASRPYPVLAAVSRRCPEPQGRFPRVTHPCAAPHRSEALDLHVLSAPPAFVLSQDQTLSFIPAHEVPHAPKRIGHPLAKKVTQTADTPKEHPPKRPIQKMPGIRPTPPPAHPLQNTKPSPTMRKSSAAKPGLRPGKPGSRPGKPAPQFIRI